MSTSLAAALAALELGHLEPAAEELSGMAPPPIEALEQTVTAIWSDLFTTMTNTSIERDIEDLGWSLVNLFHRAAAKKHGLVDRLTDDIRLLLAEQDGSEISTNDLEEKIDLAKKVEESAGAFEVMRDVAAAHYMRETGRSWVPSSGNRISLGVTAAIVDGNALPEHLRLQCHPGNAHEAGGAERGGTDDYAASESPHEDVQDPPSILSARCPFEKAGSAHASARRVQDRDPH